MMDMDLLLAQKYNIEQPERDELEGIDPQKIGCDEYKLYKLDQDRNFMLDTLLATYVDLTVNKSFKALMDRVTHVMTINAYRLFLIDDEAKNRVTRRELNRQLRQQRNHIKSAIYDSDVIIDGLKTQVEDSAMNAEIKGRYVANWQTARTEQHYQTIQDKESGPSQVIDYYKMRAEHEQRVHTEVELLINIAINDKLKEVENWMNKYDKDIETVDLKIQIKQNEYQITMEQRIAYEETLRTHEILMNKWTNFKDEREKARQYHENMTKSAVAVQAWWRGLLVRLQLGPYKVVKRRGPPPPEPTKGKKKK